MDLSEARRHHAARGRCEENKDMPMNFPDMAALVLAAEVHKFRAPNEHELEADYRNAVADHVESIDMIEAHEIRTGKGWNRWNDAEKTDLILRRLGP